MVDELPELSSTPPTKFYNPELLERGLEKFEREGLWLLLSLHHYGWRAHADIAAVLVAPLDVLELGSDLAEHHLEHKAMAGLEEMFLLLDQLWRVISGIKSHRVGNGFLAGYRRHGGDIASEFRTLQALSEDDWREIFAIPLDDELGDVLRERGVEGADELDQSRALAADVTATAVKNMQEISVFFVRTDHVAGGQARSLRDINNAYRHGTQVVYEDCSPEEIPWRAANRPEATGMLVPASEAEELTRAETVNVLLEGPDEEGHARFASMPRSAEVNESLVVGMRHLSVLLWRVVASFISAELQGGPVLSAIAPLTWEELELRFGPQPERS